MAEQKFNAELRVDRMINTDEAQIVSRCAPLPDDWLEFDLVQIANANAPTGYIPIFYKDRNEFFDLTDCSAMGYYTIIGRQMFFGGVPDMVNGTYFKISYYGEVPVFSDTQTSWIYTKYPSLSLFSSLSFTSLYAVGEEDKAQALDAKISSQIQMLNANHMRAKASGSQIRRNRVRSFG